MDDLRAALTVEVDRIADRLRGLSQARLAEPVPGHASRADAARSTAQALADAAACIEAGLVAGGDGAAGRDGTAGRDGAADTGQVATVRHILPALTDFAAGDQVAVTGHDLIAALGGAPGDSCVEEADQLAAVALEQLRALRRLL